MSDFIPISENSSPPKSILPSEELAQLRKSAAAHKKSIIRIYSIITVILIVSFIAVVGFLLDAWRFHAEAYDKFTEALNQQQNQEKSMDNRLHQFELKMQKIQFESDLKVQKIESEQQKLIGNK